MSPYVPAEPCPPLHMVEIGDYRAKKLHTHFGLGRPRESPRSAFTHQYRLDRGSALAHDRKRELKTETYSLPDEIVNAARINLDIVSRGSVYIWSTICRPFIFSGHVYSIFQGSETRMALFRAISEKEANFCELGRPGIMPSISPKYVRNI
jgi:hypothetical protein